VMPMWKYILKGIVLILLVIIMTLAMSIKAR